MSKSFGSSSGIAGARRIHKRQRRSYTARGRQKAGAIDDWMTARLYIRDRQTARRLSHECRCDPTPEHSQEKLILGRFCGRAFSEEGREAFRQYGGAASSAKGFRTITDVAMRSMFAPEFQAAESRSDARAARGIPADRPEVFAPPRTSLGPNSPPGRNSARSRSRCSSWSGEHGRGDHLPRCPTKSPQVLPQAVVSRVIPGCGGTSRNYKANVSVLAAIGDFLSPAGVRWRGIKQKPLNRRRVIGSTV